MEHLPGMHTAPGSRPSPERGDRLFSPFIGLLSAKNSQPLPGSQHQVHGAKHPRTEPSKTMSQNKPFLGKRSLRGGQRQERQGNYLTPEGEAFRGSGQLNHIQDCHTKHHSDCSAVPEKGRMCADRSVRKLPQAVLLEVKAGFLLEWNCASREETGDKIKLDFTFRTEPVRNRRRNEVLSV